MTLLSNAQPITSCEPLAIVGMACRFPKGLESIEALQRALIERFSAIDGIPSDRWTADRYYSSNPIAKGKSYIRRGGFLSCDVSRFDANFFGISPRDAENMDPQQRLMLEVVWEAFENAGLCLPQHAGRDVGVYVGGFMLDHMITQMTPSNRSQINQNTAAGMMMTMLSNRVSHTFDLCGPSLSIDTACSSSLVAFHYACQDLWKGITELAVVGGVNVMLRPEYPMGMCKGQFLSRDGECKSFDSRGDGYGRGEGAGAVLVKPLAAAIENGDPILATVIGTGTNQDGRTPGISMPSDVAQRRLIERVCDQYQIDRSKVRYVECHGTGTAVGDPIEARAVGSVYGKARGEAGPVTVGSIKSNIGHLEAGAGVAGIIKAVLTVMTRETFPLANLQSVHEEIPFEELNLRLSTDRLRLAEDDEDLYVAVNSFGYGGSNAHVVLGTPEAPIAKCVAFTNELHQSNAKTTSSIEGDGRTSDLPWMLPLSGRDESAVRQLSEKYVAKLDQDVALNDILYSAAYRRAHLNHRAVVVGSSREEIQAGLRSLASKENADSYVTGSEPFQVNRKPVLVFTGMGPQWWAMGQQLYRQDSTYRNAVDEADAVFQSISGFSILAEMLCESEEASSIRRTQYAQPANFLIQIGILAVLKSAGVDPGAVVGHSVGELGSAYAAGVLTLHDAMTVCYHRSRLQATCAGTGGMLAISMSREACEKLIQGKEHLLSIAAINSPTNLTIAGDEAAIDEVIVELSTTDIFHKKLEVEVPYHSPMMDPILDSLKESLCNLAPSVPSLPIYSSVTGKNVEAVAYDASYWADNVRESVNFVDCIRNILEDGWTTFLEVGPHPVLATSIKDCIRESGKDCRTIPTLRRQQPEQVSLHRAIMSLHVYGCNLDWKAINGTGKWTSLPNYAWQRERYWLENERAVQDRIAPINHPILGIQETPGSPVWRNDFDHEPVVYLRDHVVTGIPILPAAAYIEALLELARIQFNGCESAIVRNVSILAPMAITAERGLDFVTSFEPRTRTATIRGLENGKLGPGQVHVEASISGLNLAKQDFIALESLLQRCNESLQIDEFYKSLSAIGLQYGPMFQTIQQLLVDREEGIVLTEIALNPALEDYRSLYQLHPTLLDACFQSLMALLTNSDNTYLPTHFGEVCVYVTESPSKVWCFGERRMQTDRYIDCDLTIMDESGKLVATVRGMRSMAAGKRERVDQFGDRVKRQILSYEWNYGETLSEPKRLGHWLVLGADHPLAEETIRRIENFGAMVVKKVCFGDRSETIDGILHLRADSIEDMDQLMESCGELDGILFMNGLNSKADSFDPTGEYALAEIIQTTQALLRKPSEHLPRVYVVTQNAFAANEQDRDVQPAQTALNGFTRVAFNELEGTRFTSLDLPSDIDDSVLDTLAMELVCDAEQDEVAIRGSLRLTSELLESSVLSDDQIQYGVLDDAHPVVVRPLRSDMDSVGTARVLAAQPTVIGTQDIALRVEQMTVPRSLLLDPAADTLDQPYVEFVGMVTEVGNEVTDLAIGQRVCGFAPADLASHFYGRRDRFVLATVEDGIDFGNLLCQLEQATRAERVVSGLEFDPGDVALVENDALGRMISEILEQKGVRVARIDTLVATSRSETSPANLDYSRCPEGIDRSNIECTARNGFDIFVGNLHRWLQSFDLRILKPGGSIVDTSTHSTPVSLTHPLGSIIRSDLAVLSKRPARLQEALHRAVTKILASTMKKPFLEVSIHDIAWQKLPLADTDSTLVLSFNTRGQDLPVVQTNQMKIEPNATYLITGGFGGFGQKTAQWLVQRGAKHLVLTGRTGAVTPERQAFLDRLSEQGANIHVRVCDTSDIERMTDVIEEVKTKMPPLKGIFHSGAQILDQPIREMDRSTFASVMRSKALGAWNLHLLTQDMAIDYFVLYSSVANLVGNSRQSAYSAANGMLNGLAHHRRALGLAATSVNWGAIADVGVVAQDEKLEQFLRYTGLRGIESEEALNVMADGLARHVTQFGITMISSWADWARFETRGATSPRFASLIAADSEAKDTSMRDAIIAELKDLSPIEQTDLVAGLIIEVVAAVLRAEPEAIPVDGSIKQLGVDSLMATEIQMTLDSRLGISVSVLELIGDTSIRALAMQSVKTLLSDAGTMSAMPVLSAS